MNLIEDAKQYARESIRETWSTVEETTRMSSDTYEYDAVYIDDEACEVASVSIMHSPDANTFVLVENLRPKPNTAPETPNTSAPAKVASEIDWEKIQVDHAIAYLRGDLATSSPESYTLEEMKAISDGMFASTAEVEAAMREDFQSWTPKAQARMLYLLQQADPDHFYWWTETLMGQLPASPPTYCNNRQAN